MTKRHFEELARNLKAIKPKDKDSKEYDTWVNAVHAVVIVCQGANSRFNTAKFLGACDFE